MIRVLGQPVHALDLRQAVERLGRGVEGGERQFVVALNPEKIVRALHDPELAGALRQATLVLPDGVGVVLAAAWQGSGVLPRVPGIDLFGALLARAHARGERVFLHGARPEVCAAAARRVGERFPGAVVAGALHGYQDEAEVVERIGQARPHYLFVALGSPRQEKWLARHLPGLPPLCAMGVGGSFDVLAGHLRRAPRLMQRTGTEWLFRLAQEPRRLRRAPALAEFLLRVAGRAR